MKFVTNYVEDHLLAEQPVREFHKDPVLSSVRRGGQGSRSVAEALERRSTRENRLIAQDRDQRNRTTVARNANETGIAAARAAGAPRLTGTALNDANTFRAVLGRQRRTGAGVRDAENRVQNALSREQRARVQRELQRIERRATAGVRGRDARRRAYDRAVNAALNDGNSALSRVLFPSLRQQSPIGPTRPARRRRG